MARKASMLDIFQMSDKQQTTRATRAPRGKASGSSSGTRIAKSGPAKSGRRGTRDVAVALSQRHVVYAASIVVLLVALSFVLGIAAGSGGSDDDGHALSATAPTGRPCYVKGTLNKTSWTDHQRVDLRRVVKTLYRSHGVAREDLQVLEDETTYYLFVGSFGNEARAQRYIEAHGLATFDAGGGQFPFVRLEIVDDLE